MPEQKPENYAGKSPGRFRKRLLLSIIVGLAIFVGLSIYADVGDVIQAFAEFKWSYIPLILFLTCSMLSLHAFGYKFIYN